MNGYEPYDFSLINRLREGINRHKYDDQGAAMESPWILYEDSLARIERLEAALREMWQSLIPPDGKSTLAEYMDQINDAICIARRALESKT